VIFLPSKHTSREFRWADAKAKERQWDLTDNEAVSMFYGTAHTAGHLATFKAQRIDGDMRTEAAPAHAAQPALHRQIGLLRAAAALTQYRQTWC
jgi:hypothetical protein